METLLGAISQQEEFFYPDTPLSALPERLRLVMAKNGRPGIQLLLKSQEESLPIALESGHFNGEFFAMHAIPVEYNTGNGEDQGGAMVLLPEKKPDYATRLAPFQVYDCLEPVADGQIPIRDGLAAAYICLIPEEQIQPGIYQAVLTLGAYRCTLEIQVFDVDIPVDTFPVTNWFSLDAICRLHQVEAGTEAFYAMVRKYADAMRRLHQTMFYIELDDTCVVSRDPYRFDFSYLRPLIQCFFDAGMQTLEIGPLLSRGFLPDGMPDMYTDRFKCAMAPQVPIDTEAGYGITVTFVQALADFLRQYGWQDKVVFHIHDEPDIHVKSEADLERRKGQYYLAASILRKYLPQVRVIEAVSSAQFRGGVDIWVLGTPGYEANRQELDKLAALGEEIWAYVCCGPEGHWLNRFLDFALLKGRLLFWGCAKYRLGGFLHWGFNQFQMGMNPFQGTSCPNHTGIGTNFPCGDAFLVYPGTDGPWPGMRMEAARRGAEDAALLAMLRRKDEKAHDALVERVFRDNQNYNDDPVEFNRVYADLLRLLEK